MTTLLALVGDQPMPNVIGALHHVETWRSHQRRHGLDRVVFLVSRDRTGQAHPRYQRIYERTADLLHELGGLSSERRLVQPYDPDDVEDVCQQVLQEYAAEGPVVFNITGGTKIMSLAAQRVAQAQNCPILYVDSAQAQVLYLERGRQPEPFHLPDLSITHYLAVHGVCTLDQLTDQEHQQRDAYSSGRYREAAVSLAQGGHSARSWLDGLRRWAQRQRLEKPWTQPFEPAGRHARLVARLAELGLLQDVYGDGLSYQVVDPTAWHFLGGPWLEVYAHDQARQTGHFHDCQRAVRIDWAAGQAQQPVIENELDLVLIHNALLTICSCKTGRPISRQDADPNMPIYQLETIARSAGLFCRKVLITNRFDLPPTFVQRARIFGIQVIAGPDLPRLGELLVGRAQA